MLVDDGKRDPKDMAEALRALPQQARPSEVVIPGLLEGLVNVSRLIEPTLKRQDPAPAQKAVQRRA
jgi:hypothetical protein